MSVSGERNFASPAFAVQDFDDLVISCRGVVFQLCAEQTHRNARGMGVIAAADIAVARYSAR